MCDYSLEARASRPATNGEYLRTSGFQGTPTRGFCPLNENGVAVCLLPGTELAFDKPVSWQGIWPMLSHLFRQSSSRTAVFRKVNEDKPAAHHDALELDDGTVVLVSHLREGQMARVLQLPAAAKPNPASAQQTPELDRQVENVS